VDSIRYADIATRHAENAAFLWHLRGLAVAQPHYRLDDLGMLDERLAAHLDGLRELGEAGLRACRRLLAEDEAWAVAPLALLTLEAGERRHLERIVAVAEARPEFAPVLEATLGWASPGDLRGVVQALLQSSSPLARRLGIASCAMHRVDPGPALAAAIADPDPALRARALRAAGELGRRDLLPACLEHLDNRGDANADGRHWAAVSGLLLGERHRAVAVLAEVGSTSGPAQVHALQIVLKAMDDGASRLLLAPLAHQPMPRALRALIQGVGHTGRAVYARWLIDHMHRPETARIAGEAFTLITGADLVALELDRTPPDDGEFGPSDDPDDEHVAMDEDEDLPWPDADRVMRWWDAQGDRFPEGSRHFLGHPVDETACRDALRHGFQRQRVAAADHLALLRPGQPLFPTSAPERRQRRLLDQPG
jgi:uncharacterized protein (TIGR02270 family)